MIIGSRGGWTPVSGNTLTDPSTPTDGAPTLLEEPGIGVTSMPPGGFSIKIGVTGTKAPGGGMAT